MKTTHTHTRVCTTSQSHARLTAPHVRAGRVKFGGLLAKPRTGIWHVPAKNRGLMWTVQVPFDVQPKSGSHSTFSAISLYRKHLGWDRTRHLGISPCFGAGGRKKRRTRLCFLGLSHVYTVLRATKRTFVKRERITGDSVNAATTGTTVLRSAHTHTRVASLNMVGGRGGGEAARLPPRSPPLPGRTDLPPLPASDGSPPAEETFPGRAAESCFGFDLTRWRARDEPVPTRALSRRFHSVEEHRFRILVGEQLDVAQHIFLGDDAQDFAVVRD